MTRSKSRNKSRSPCRCSCHSKKSIKKSPSRKSHYIWGNKDQWKYKESLENKTREELVSQAQRLGIKSILFYRTKEGLINAMMRWDPVSKGMRR